MEKTDAQRRITEQMDRCARAMATFVANAGDNTRCRTVEIQSVVKVMRVSADLAMALARMRDRRHIITVTREGVPETEGSNGTPP